MRHSHSFLAGFVGGLVLDQETLIVLVIGLAVGAFGGVVVREAVAAFRWVGRRLDERPPVDRRPW